MRKTPSFKRTRKQHGLAAIETVIVLPLFLLLFFAIVEVGRLTIQCNTLTKQQRTAARFLADHAFDDATYNANIAATRNLVVYGSTVAGQTPVLNGLTPAMVNVVRQVDRIQITTTYRYVPLWGNQLPAFFGEGINVTPTFVPSVVMRIL